MRGQGRDAGVSLVELLVATVITGVVLAVLAPLLVGALRTTAYVSAKTSTAADARTAVAVLVQTLRVTQPLDLPTGSPAGTDAGQALVSATSKSVVFYASLAGSDADPTPTRVEYSYDTTRRCFAERRTPGVRSTAGTFYTFSGTTSTRCLAFGTVNDTIFTYYTLESPDENGPPQLAAWSELPIAGAPGTAMDAVSLTHVDRIGISLDVTQGATGRTAHTAVDASVSLVNLLDVRSR